MSPPNDGRPGDSRFTDGATYLLSTVPCQVPRGIAAITVFAAVYVVGALGLDMASLEIFKALEGACLQ